MRDDNKIARKYATALFGLAKERDVLQVVWDDLSVIADVVKGERRLLLLLTSPQLSVSQKKSLWDRVLTESAQPIVRNLLHVLIDKGRSAVLLRIVELYRDLLDDEQGYINATITTAVPLNDEERDAIVERLERLSGRSVRYRLEVDPALLGGVVVVWGGQIIDHSVQQDLVRLRETLGAVKVYAAA